MSVVTQYRLSGSSASEISASVEAGVRSGRLAAQDRLPTVRGLADELGVSPTTVASAYRDLQRRGVIETGGRRGTRIAARPPIAVRTAPPVPQGVRDLSMGTPDPQLLPSYLTALRSVSREPRLYEGREMLPELVEVAREAFASDGVKARHIGVVGGALDGVERVLRAQLRAGDRVAVEDPGYANLLDLLAALGLSPVSLPVDDEGVEVEALHRAVRGGVAAVVITPRAQNPYGAALSARRARELRAVVRAGNAVVIEDDFAAEVAGAELHSVASAAPRWAILRSVSKGLGPDLRLAFLAGDEETVARVSGLQRLGTGWVSGILQELVCLLSGDAGARRAVVRATERYAARRGRLVAALDAHGIGAHGRSGLNVWVPVADETAVVQRLLEAGWAVAAGERFRLASPRGIRITITTLRSDEVDRLAADVADAVRGGSLRYNA